MTPPLPVGFTIRPTAGSRRTPDGSVWWGGSPWRVIRLSPRGAAVARSLADGTPVADEVDGALARRLVAGGLAVAVPPVEVDADVEVVVPVRDRAGDLARCLAALRQGSPSWRVTVVDDGSRDPVAVAAVADRYDAALVRRPVNGGAAAARDDGLAHVVAPAVAFVDVDALVDPGTVRRLAAHLADPLVAAVAPRVRPVAASGLLATFAAARSPLDQGPHSATVVPRGRPSYVPSVVLVARTAALRDVHGFSPELRVGEDVDLCWRLADAGWVVRYDADAVAGHREPTTWGAWLSRRHRYGTSAGPLAVRHGDRLGGPALRAAVAAVALVTRRVPVPAVERVRTAAQVGAATAVGLVGWGLPLWSGALVVAGRRTRLAALGAYLVVAETERRRRGAAVDPLRWAVACAADDVAYAAGVWRGAVAARAPRPVLPVVGRVRSCRSGSG